MTEKKKNLIQFNRNRILETAERLFSEKGVKATTVDDISKAADYSKSTIYVYFKSKDEIYSHIVHAHMHRLRETIDTCIRISGTFEQCYFNICKVFTTAYEQYPLYFESVLGNISIDEKEMSENEILKRIYEEGEAINDSMIMLFEKGIQERYLRQDILILPAVFTLWASLANTIITANKKENYIAKRMKMSKAEFLTYSFQLLLLSIKEAGCCQAVQMYPKEEQE